MINLTCSSWNQRKDFLATIKPKSKSPYIKGGIPAAFKTICIKYHDCDKEHIILIFNIYHISQRFNIRLMSFSRAK